MTKSLVSIGSLCISTLAGCVLVEDDLTSKLAEGSDGSGEPNTPPALTFSLSSGQAEFNEGETISFVGTVIDAEDSADQISFVWSSDVDGEFSTEGADSTGALSLSIDSLTYGTHVVTLTATDSGGLFAQRAVSLSINGLPTAPSVTLEPSPAYTTDDLTAETTASTDPDQSGTVTYRYEWFEDGVPSEVSTGATFPRESTIKSSTYRVVVTPNDSIADGPSGEAEVTISNAAPVIADLALDSTTVRVGDTLTCTASVSDADADDTPTLSFEWHDGSAGSTYVVSEDDNPTSSVTCTAIADDQDGGVTTESVDAVVENTLPVVDTIEVSPAEGRVGDGLTCRATASDADGDEPTVTYEWHDGSTSDTYTIQESDDPNTTVTCTATASDPDGGAASQDASALVLNTDPSISAATITPTTAYNDDVITCAATATDADGGAPSIAYTWTGSSAGPLASTASVDLSTTSSSSGETITCSVSASDADGGSASTSTDIVLSNRDPSVTTAISPTTDPTRDDELVCTPSTSDPDNDTVSASYSWTVNGSAATPTTSSATGSSLADAFVRGDSVCCAVSVTDGKGGSDSDTDCVTIVNQPPTVTILSMAPTTAFTDDTLSVNIDATDTDGDSISLTYDWYVNGTVVQSGSDNTLDGSLSSGGFSKDDDVYVEIQADDGTDTSTTTSATVTIANTPPGAPGVRISPTEPAAGEDLLCTVTTASPDADGDSVTYSMAWTADGTAYAAGSGSGWVGPSTSTYTNDTVDGSDTASGETWECTVTPSDGDDDGSTATTSVEVTGGITTNGLLHEYRFDDRGGQTLTDYYSGADGTIGLDTVVDAYDPTWDSGFLRFSTSCVQLPFDPTTLSAWSIQFVLRGNSQSGQVRLANVKADSRSRWRFTPTGSQMRFVFATGTSDSTTIETTLDSGPVLDGTWNVLSFTQSPSNAVSIYTNTILNDSDTLHATPSFSTWNNTYIGGAECGHDSIAADIAYIVIYDRALSSTEVSDNVSAFEQIINDRGL